MVGTYNSIRHIHCNRDVSVWNIKAQLYLAIYDVLLTIKITMQARKQKASSTVHVSKSAIIVPGDHGSCKSIFFCEEILISLHSMYMYSQMFYTFIF